MTESQYLMALAEVFRLKGERYLPTQEKYIHETVNELQASLQNRSK